MQPNTSGQALQDHRCERDTHSSFPGEFPSLSLPHTWLLGYSLVPHQTDGLTNVWRDWVSFSRSLQALCCLPTVLPGLPELFCCHQHWDAAPGWELKAVDAMAVGEQDVLPRSSSAYSSDKMLPNCPWQCFCSVQDLILWVRALLASGC